MKLVRAACLAIALALVGCEGVRDDATLPITPPPDEAPVGDPAATPDSSSAAPAPTDAPAEVATWELPAAAMDIEIVSTELGFVSLADGQLLGFRPPSPSTQSLDWWTVEEGLAFPRGLAVTGGYLYVAEIGPMPCDPPYPYCFGGAVGPTRVDGERAILEQSSGSIARFRITESGGLGERELVLDGIPVANTEHGVNDVEVGPDGRLYVAVGHVERLFFEREVLAAVRHPARDWLGSVLVIDVSTDGTEVFSHGLRNVYGLAFTPDGRLYGVDNDGPAGSGFRQEELLEIVEGADYGFPDEGSPGVLRQRAVAVMPTIGSAGIAAVRDDLLLIGGCNGLFAVGLTEGDGHFALADRPRQIAQVNGCVTGIDIIGDHALLSLFPAKELTLVRIDE